MINLSSLSTQSVLLVLAVVHGHDSEHRQAFKSLLILCYVMTDLVDIGHYIFSISHF